MALIALYVFAAFIVIFLAIFIKDFIKNRKSHYKYHRGEVIMAFILLAPSVVLAFFLVLLPIITSLGFSFTNYTLGDPNNISLAGGDGFGNFRDLISEFQIKGDFYHAIKNTAIFVVFVVPIQIGLALGLALFVNNKRRGTTIFKVCFFAPVAVSLSVTAFFWREVLANRPDGIMNSILANFGIPNQDFLGTDKILGWMIAISAWQGCGYQMLIFLSALGNIRKDLYEAARVDGANAFHRFKTVTIPGLRPTMLFILITVFIGACRVLIQPMLLDQGVYPGSVTLSLYMYNQGQKYGNVGLSCAVALLMTIVIGSITFLQRQLLKEKKK